MKYTEDDLRKAFQAGIIRGVFLEANEYAPFTVPFDEDEYIDSLTETIEEDKIGFTYSFLRRKLGWEEFCDATGVDYYATRNGFEIKDNEIFNLTITQAKKYELL